MPFAVKDNIEVAGGLTTAACPAFTYQAAVDASAVARLKTAGAVLMGLAHFSREQARQMPEEIWQLFTMLKEMKQRRGGDLSGGQQQTLVIAPLR